MQKSDLFYFQQDHSPSLTPFIKMCPEVNVADNSNASQEPAS